MSQFTIGPGVLQAMTDAGDEPRSDEVYRQPGISETYGRDGIYYYIAQDNATRRVPFDVR